MKVSLTFCVKFFFSLGDMSQLFCRLLCELIGCHLTIPSDELKNCSGGDILETKKKVGEQFSRKMKF